MRSHISTVLLKNGLRDYGTATWEGGDEDCDHQPDKSCPTSTLEGGKTTQGEAKFYKEICVKCGAKRIDDQIGLEKTPEQYVAKMVEICREIRRILKPKGNFYLNLGDSYASGKSRYSTVEQGFERDANKNGSDKYGSLLDGNRPDFKNHPVIKDKDLIGIPWTVALALRADGWWLREDIIWAKPNPMPESVKDRCTKSHEYIFHLTKSAKYYYDYEAILEPANYDGRLQTQYNGGNKDVSCFAYERWSRKIGKRPIGCKETGQGNEYSVKIRGFKTKDGLEPNPQHHGSSIGNNIMGHSGYFNADGEPNVSFTNDGIPARNKRDVWTVATKPFPDAHFAVYPPELILPCVLAGCPKGGVILDPFFGAGTTGLVAVQNFRNYIGIELNPDYIEIANKRIKAAQQQTRLDLE